MTQPNIIDMPDMQRLRGDFPIPSARAGRGTRCAQLLIYLDNAATTQRPRQVVQAMAAGYEGYYANVHRGVYRQAEGRPRNSRRRGRKCSRPSMRPAPSRSSLPRHLNGINLVARSWGDASCGPVTRSW